MQSTSNDLAVQREVAGDAPRLVDVGTVVERRLLARQQRLAEGLEGEVERQVVVVAPEAEHAAGLEAAEPHPAVEVRRVEQVGRLGERLVPAPLEGGQLPRHDRGVVDHEHAAELDAHVRPERRIEVPEQLALGHHPREPDGLGPPGIVGLGRVELVVLRARDPTRRLAGRSWRRSSWQLAHRCEVAIGERRPSPPASIAVSRAAWRRQYGRTARAVERSLLDRRAQTRDARSRRRRPAGRAARRARRAPASSNCGPRRSASRRYLRRRATPLARVAAKSSTSGDARRRGGRASATSNAHDRSPSSSASVSGGGSSANPSASASASASNARVQRVVDQLPRDLAPRVAGAQTRRACRSWRGTGRARGSSAAAPRRW